MTRGQMAGNAPGLNVDLGKIAFALVLAALCSVGARGEETLVQEILVTASDLVNPEERVTSALSFYEAGGSSMKVRIGSPSEDNGFGKWGIVGYLASRGGTDSWYVAKPGGGWEKAAANGGARYALKLVRDAARGGNSGMATRVSVTFDVAGASPLTSPLVSEIQSSGVSSFNAGKTPNTEWFDPWKQDLGQGMFLPGPDAPDGGFVSDIVIARIASPREVADKPGTTCLVDISGLVFRRPSEAFPGEAAAFSSSEALRAIPYREKALSLLGTLLDGKGGAVDYREMVRASFGIDLAAHEGAWTSETGSDSWDETRTACANRLGRSLVSYLRKVSSVDARLEKRGGNVFDVDLSRKAEQSGSLFRELYGHDRDVYLSAYLLYAYRHGKGAFNSAALASGGKFDWRNYSWVGGGIDENAWSKDCERFGMELAEAAMRFYTWGVEYSLERPETSTISVQEGNGQYFHSSIDASWWSAGGFTGNWIENHYLGELAELRSLPAPKDGSQGVPVTIEGLPDWFAKGFKVPFPDGVSGYPLPYARYGFDSPRTFAYKLKAQLEALKATGGKRSERDTTKAFADSAANYATTSGANPSEDAWILSKDKTEIKPFVPGSKDFGTKGAGVNALGFLSQCVAMTSKKDLVKGCDPALDPISNLASYNAMDPREAATALSKSDGLPRFAYVCDDPSKKDTESIRAEKRKHGWIFDYALRAHDLEKVSMIVPDLSLVQVGDIVVRFGDDGASGADPLHVGIVVGILPGDRPAFGAPVDHTFLSRILVVSVSPRLAQVTLGSWGNPEGGFGGFADDPERYHVRRLLWRTASEEGTPTATAWDVLETAPFGTVSFDTMREHTRTGESKVKERWIPNTGEYLELGDMRLSMKNAFGRELDFGGFSDGLEVFPVGAIDRNFGSSELDSGGNVVNNTACEFDLVLVDSAGTEFVPLGKLVPDGRGEYAFMPSGSKNGIYRETGELKDAKRGMFVEARGTVKVSLGGERGYRLAIRPESASMAMPGDDLLLRFRVREAGTKEAMPGLGAFTADQANYIATYDKKALWRANLYIEEVNGKDWNELHPWNAPPDSGKRVKKNLETINTVDAESASPWWDASWGYNEWNRDWGSNRQAWTLVSKTIAELPPGDGKQIIVLPEFTPIWRIASEAERSKNVLSRTVSYSYPGEWLDGHMDSPFDFKKKMFAMRQTQFKWYCEEKNNPMLRMYLDKERVPKDSPVTFSSTLAPGNVWGHYPARSHFDAGEARYSFLPGLGLHPVWPYTAKHGNQNPPKVDISMTDSKTLTGLIHALTETEHIPFDIGKGYPFPAGTDCLGFAQRAYSYKTPYAWGELRKEWAEDSANLYPEYGNAIRGRKYPRCAMDGDTLGYLIFDRDNAPYVSSERTERYVGNVTPGEVCYYNGHIMLVADVVPDQDGRIRTSNVTLIEATYWAKKDESEYKKRKQEVIKIQNLTWLDATKWRLIRLRKR